MTINFNKEQFFSNLEKYGSSLIYKKISIDMITVISCFANLQRQFKDNIFLLESAENGNNKGRFSIIGFDPDQIWRCNNNLSQINKNFSINSNDFIDEKNSPILSLKNFINDAKIDWEHLFYDNSILPSVCSGVFGYMAYDMIRIFEKILDNNLHDNLRIPNSLFIRPQVLIVFDNFYDCALVCAPSYKNGNKNYDELVAKINNIIKIIQQPVDDYLNNSNVKFDENFVSNFSKQQYCDVVVKSKKYIENGDIFQILPSQRFQANFDKNLNPFNFYRSLRSVNPSPFLYYFQFKDFVITGSSPEIMVSLKNKIATIRPLAGTRKRGKDAQEDKLIALELQNDEKEIAEHLMLIDLGRHDIGAISKAKTVRVTKKMAIEYYSHVMHLSSNVEGEIRDDLDAVDALIAGFPAGTVTGAPKIRAMEIIEEIETEKRSFYAGCAGYFASNSDMETCITLRSALIKDEKIYLQSGAGVVYDSIPDNEYQECLNKAQALIKAYHNIKNFIK